jgi:hypothetical protein
MSNCCVVSYDVLSHETAHYLLSIASKCIADSRTDASCQLIARGTGGVPALLVVGRAATLKKLAEMLRATFIRWGEPVPGIEGIEQAAPSLRAAFPMPSTQTAEWRLQKLASLLHEHWRQDYLAKNPGKTRIKKTSDTAWTADHHGLDEVDLAATPFVGLPADWQTENYAAARHVLSVVDEGAVAGVAFTDEFVEEAAAGAHDQWLGRNHTSALDVLRGTFVTLPSNEQHKDRVQVYLAKLVHDVWPPA